jgi:DNA sulfur modification protein DndE
MTLDTVRISQRGKDQLIRLKRITGIGNWNILCRWALATSLADPTVPLVRDIRTDSNIEMTWRTFGGPWADVYYAHVVLRAHEEAGSVSIDDIEQTFLAHLHRGIGYLAGSPDLRGIADLVAAASSHGGADQPVPA